MLNTFSQRVIQPLVLPAALLFLAWFLLPYQTRLPVSLSGIMSYAPYWSLSIAVTIGIFYNRGKVVLSTILLGIGLYLFNWYTGEEKLEPTRQALIQLGLQGFLPINLALLGIYAERGVFTFHMLYRSALIAGQLAMLVAIFAFPTVPFAVAFEQYILAPVIEPLFVFPESVPTLVAYFNPIFLVDVLAVLGFLVVALSAFWFNSATSFGLLGVYIAYLLGIHIDYPPNLLSANVMAASLLLCIALLRDSYNMAYRDELTSLPQRRAMNEHMMALGANYTLAMADVDHFKKFNDTHGHDVGDQVLQMVASQIGKIKGGGRAYRYGGEEFAIIFPNGNLDEACYHLDDVRKSIQDYEMVIRAKQRPEDPGKQRNKLRKRGSYRNASKKVSVTISIGAANRIERGESPEDVLKRADQVLYKAKKAGRNKVMS
jgi:GGDEF domain-containing protein